MATHKEPKPGWQRCKGVYTGRRYQDKAGQQCEQYVAPGREFCGAHNLPDERRCTGTYSPTNKDGKTGRCTGRALKGQNVCAFHGGSTKRAKAAAERRLNDAKVDSEVRRKLAKMDVGPVDNPLTALSQLAGQVVAWQEALAERVNALTDIRYLGASGEQLRSEVALYERAMDRANAVLGTMGRLNIDERLARVSEKQAERVITAVDALLLHLGVTGEQAVEAKKFLARRLRAA